MPSLLHHQRKKHTSQRQEYDVKSDHPSHPGQGMALIAATQCDVQDPDAADEHREAERKKEERKYPYSTQKTGHKMA